MAAFTVRVSEETDARLDQLAEIEAGLAEADRGEFATEEEIAQSWRNISGPYPRNDAVSNSLDQARLAPH